MDSNAGTINSGYLSTTQQFPDPLMDYAGSHMPRDLRTLLRWCEILWANNGTYRMALERVCAYFLTKIELLDVGDNVKGRYEDFLEDTLQINRQLRAVGLDFLFYGNSFSSVYKPFRRYLRCKHCQLETPINRLVYTFREFKFYAACGKCGNQGEHKMIDRRSMEQDKLKIIRWNPYQMRILHHPISHDSMYLIDMPATFKEHIKRGRHFYLEHTPWEIVESIQNDQLFKFNDGVIYHFKEDTLAGLQNRGWGLPRALSGFKLGYHIQILRRYNEALALDYIVPWRIITPGSKGTTQLDPLLNANMSDFVSKIRGMVIEHRRDPLSVHALPFPVEYQVLGGEAKQLAPQELMTVALDELLNSIGVPSELYKGTLQLQAAPTALRLFEATWPHLVAGFNSWINWLLEQVSGAFSWERARGRLTPVTRADDIEARVIRLQLSAANKISDQTALSPLGIDIRDEIRKIFEEQKMRDEENQKFQQEMAQAQEMQQRLAETQAIRSGMMGGMGGAQAGMTGGIPPQGPGGAMGPMGAPGSAGGPVTPEDILSQSEQVSQQLLGMPEGERRRQLSALRQSNPTLHAVVKEKMAQGRSQARSIGQDQVLAQMTGQGPPV